MPPFAWRHLPAPMNDVPQTCSVESAGGTKWQGEMLGFEPTAATITFRSARGAPSAVIPFYRFHRLTIAAPLRATPPIPGAPVERLPAAAQEREYRLHADDRREPLVGRTVGHIQTDHGLYLFTPIDEDASLQRVFVPRSAYTRIEFGQSAEEIAASRWIGSRQALIEAIGRQQRMAVLPLGQSLLALGLLTQLQLDRALADKLDNRVIGERLVASGVITESDLQTAIAHKMGYPMVDLTRFPVDTAAVVKLPQRVALSQRAMPLMFDGPRLVVAVDKPSRLAKLQELNALAGVPIVPVLAPKAQILTALGRLSQDVWT